MPKPEVRRKTNRDYQRFRRSQGPSLLRSLDTEILRYARSQGTTVECALRDALTDLRHIADIHKLNFWEMDHSAHEGYSQELTDLDVEIADD